VEVPFCYPLITCPGDFEVDAVDTEGDLALLANCAVVGALWVHDTSLTHLDGLSNLTSVLGGLTIHSNEALTNPDGLSRLASVGGGLFIGGTLAQGNGALTNLDGLASLTSVGGDLTINYNNVLCQSSVDALVAACTIGGSTTAEFNDDGC
jgi:hypothetical protein